MADPTGVTSQPPRSPLYEALHARRYQRQAIIREIEAITDRRLGVYFANVGHPDSGINQTDIAPIQDVLSDCDCDCDLDLLLQTPGGDIDIAEKLVYMIRQRVRGFRVIVVERAKSAGTLIGLAADEILMSSTSELGPIDPQITISTAEGRPVNRPARSFLDGLELIKQDVKNNGGFINPAYFPLLSQLDPALIDFCVKSIGRAEQFAEKWLKLYMLKGKARQASKIAKRLTDVAMYRSHGILIDANEAKSMGLNVRFVASDDPLWQKLWSLHLAYQIEVTMFNTSKIVETRRVSIPL